MSSKCHVAHEDVRMPMRFSKWRLEQVRGRGELPGEMGTEARKDGWQLSPGDAGQGGQC